jgi:hypothetical protein
MPCASIFQEMIWDPCLGLFGFTVPSPFEDQDCHSAIVPISPQARRSAFSDIPWCDAMRRHALARLWNRQTEAGAPNGTLGISQSSQLVWGLVWGLVYGLVMVGCLVGKYTCWGSLKFPEPHVLIGVFHFKQMNVDQTIRTLPVSISNWQPKEFEANVSRLTSGIKHPQLFAKLPMIIGHWSLHCFTTPPVKLDLENIQKHPKNQTAVAGAQATALPFAPLHPVAATTR